jgi:hypothetical protein
VRDAAEFQLEVQVLDGGRYAAFLVARGDDYRQESEWRSRCYRQLAVCQLLHGGKAIFGFAFGSVLSKRGICLCGRRDRCCHEEKQGSVIGEEPVCRMMAMAFEPSRGLNEGAFFISTNHSVQQGPGSPGSAWFFSFNINRIMLVGGSIRIAVEAKVIKLIDA